MTSRSPLPPFSSSDSPAAARGWALASIVGGLLLTLTLSSLDATIVGTALPTIARDLHGFNQYAWVVTAYLLTSTTVIPVAGKLSDQFGRKRFLLSGIALFLLGSVLAGTSQTMTELVVFRGLQGLGAGFMQTLAFTLVADLFSPAERGRWQGVFVSVLALALIVGPLIGGAITDHASWRWVFYVNLPIGVIALLVLGLLLPAALKSRSAAARGWAAVRRIDVPGALCASSATVCLLLALTWGGTTYAWWSPQVIGLLVAAGALYLGFVLSELVVREPLLPLDLFRNQIFAVSSLLALAGGMVIYAMIFYLPLFMQGVLGLTATTSGASLAPLFVPVAVSSVVGGQLITKLGRYHALAIIGSTILLAGLVLLWRLDTEATLTNVTLDMIVVGAGIGILQPIYTVAGQNAIPSQLLGTGTGAMNYLRAMGSLLGTAILGAIVIDTAATGRHSGLSLTAQQVLASSLNHVFFATLLVGVGMLVLTLLLRDARLRKRGEGP